MTELPILPAFPEKNIAITMQSSDFFAPYTSVTIKSLMDHTSADHNYDIIVTTKDMTEENAAILYGMADQYANISIRVTNVKEIYDQLIQVEDKRFGGETVARIFLMELLPDYDKVLNLDSDMIVCADVAELYNTDISDYYMGAVQDLQSYVSFYKYKTAYFNRDFVNNTLKLNSIEQYFNGGLFLLNLQKIRERFTAQEIAETITAKQFRFFEQDAFSYLFRSSVLALEWSWNWQCDADKNFQSHVGLIFDISGYRLKFKKARQKPKIIHYLSQQKPWHSEASDYADIWWSYAATVPFYGVILQRKNYAPGSSNIGDRILFVCETPYHLFNVIQLKHHFYKDIIADVLFTASANFSPYISSLKELNLFGKIYEVGYSVTKDISKLRESAPNTQIVKAPNSYEYYVDFPFVYSDYYMPVLSSPYQKIIYYMMIHKNMCPKVHIYEDGAITYIENVTESIAKDTLNHNVIMSSKRFSHNITEILVRNPGLYLANNENIRISKLPEFNASDIVLTGMLEAVFGKQELPKEKYIFFNESFISEGLVSNDVEILEEIAKIVGKENIIIKLHPRATAEKTSYVRHGFKIYDTEAPWETVIMNPEIEKKVLLSVSSNSIVTPWSVGRKKPYSIYLWKVMKLSLRHHVRESGFPKFIFKTEKIMNYPEKRMFSPNSVYELREIIKYVEGEL